MTAWCTTQLNWILWLAVAFLAASLLIGAMSAIKALMAKPVEPADASKVKTLGLDGQPIGPILEALKGLIEALGKAPAWFALFLAGLFLFWLAGDVYVAACKPPSPPPCAQQCPRPVSVPSVRAPGTPPPAGTPQRPAGTGNTQ